MRCKRSLTLLMKLPNENKTSSTEKMTLYFQLAGILSSISMGGAFIIILSYLLTPALRRHPINLVFFLAIADFFYNLKWVVTSVVQGSVDCRCSVAVVVVCSNAPNLP
jgi:hypothetical protein